MRLEVNGKAWPLAKTGRNHFVPADRFDLKACDGVIVVSIDGKEHRSFVRVVNGVCFFDTRVAIERMESDPKAVVQESTAKPSASRKTRKARASKRSVSKRKLPGKTSAKSLWSKSK